MQGVSIIIAVKRRRKAEKSKSLATVQHGELWGSRSRKYDALWEGSLPSLVPTELPNNAPQFAFVERDYVLQVDYDLGFSVTDLMPTNVTGIVSMGDNFIIKPTQTELIQNIQFLLQSGCSASDLTARFGLGKNYADWVVEGRSKLEFDETKIVPIAYRPFDTFWTYFDNKLLWRWREKIMRSLIDKPNVAMAICRQGVGEDWANVFVSNLIGDDSYVSNRSRERGYFCPLYLYPEEGTLETSARVNFDPKIYAEIRERAGLNQKPSPLAGGEGAAPAAEGEGGDGAAPSPAATKLGPSYTRPSPSLAPSPAR